MPGPRRARGDGEARLTLREHLQELRSRLTKAVLALVATTALAFFFAPHIFRILLVPARGLNLVFIEMTEMLGTYMKVSVMSGLVLALPYILYQLVMFAAPGLTATEKRYVLVLLPAAAVAFATGVVFGYFVLMPPAMNFLLTFGADIATPQIRIGNYVNLVTTLLFWIGLSFELPLVVFLLSRIGVVTPRSLSRNRPLAIVAAFLLGGVITPTFDPVNQTLVALPLIVLYEIGIWLAKLAARSRRRAARGKSRSSAQ